MQGWFNLAAVCAALMALLVLSLLIRQWFFDRPMPKPLTDADILRVAQEGDRTTAVRWYRTLHRVDLGPATEAVDAMIAEQPQEKRA